MANIKIDGDSIKTKEDATKFLQDVDASFVKEEWKEHDTKLDDEERKYNKEMYKIMKDRVVDRVMAVTYPDGLYEKLYPNGKPKSAGRYIWSDEKKEWIKQED